MERPEIPEGAVEAAFTALAYTAPGTINAAFVVRHVLAAAASHIGAAYLRWAAERRYPCPDPQCYCDGNANTYLDDRAAAHLHALADSLTQPERDGDTGSNTHADT